jgi:hypothetical protein
MIWVIARWGRSTVWIEFSKRSQPSLIQSSEFSDELLTPYSQEDISPSQFSSTFHQTIFFFFRLFPDYICDTKQCFSLSYSSHWSNKGHLIHSRKIFDHSSNHKVNANHPNVEQVDFKLAEARIIQADFWCQISTLSLILILTCTNMLYLIS